MNTARERLRRPAASRADSRLRDVERHKGVSETQLAGRADEVDALGDVLRRERIYRRTLGLADALAVQVASVVTGTRLGWVALAAVPLVILESKLQGLYDRHELVIFKSTLQSFGVFCRWRPS